MSGNPPNNPTYTSVGTTEAKETEVKMAQISEIDFNKILKQKEELEYFKQRASKLLMQMAAYMHQEGLKMMNMSDDVINVISQEEKKISPAGTG